MLKLTAKGRMYKQYQAINPQEVAKRQTNDFVFEVLQVFSLFLAEIYKDKDKMVYEYPRKFKPFHETIEKELSRNLEWNFLLRFSFYIKFDK